MAAVATFDTLKFANTLKAAGVPEKQAEAQAVAFAEVIQLNFKDLATKDDVATLGKGQQAALDAAVKGQQAALDAAVKDLRQEIAEVKQGLASLKDELVREMEKLFVKLKQEFDEKTHKLDMTDTRHAGEMLLIKWMLGATLTGVTGILIRLFFFRTP